MNQIKPINNPLNRQGRNDFNHNFSVLDKRTKATNQTIETLVVESGTSDAETILARNGEKSLKARLDKTDAYIDRQDEQILLQAQRYADTLGLDGNVSVDDLESIVFKDDYQAEWEKNLKDYEELKVGVENLEINSDFTQGGRTSKWNSVYGSFVVEKNQLKKTVTEIALHNRIEFILSSGSYTDAETYTLTLWAEIPTFSQWERFDNAVVLSQKTDDDFGVGIKKTMVTFKIIDKSKASLIRFYTPSAPIGEVQVIDRYKLTEGEVSFRDEWTPTPKDINAQPFLTSLAQDIRTAKEEIWNKAERDYELLKVGRRNLIKTSEIKEGLFIGVSGVIGSATEQNLSGLIDIGNHKTVTFKGYRDFPNVNIGMWDKDMNWIRRGNYAPNIDNDTRVQVLDNNTRFIRISSLGLRNGAKLEIGDAPTPYTPNPQDINASPFTVKLAQDFYNQQQEINELRNAILTLGGK